MKTFKTAIAFLPVLLSAPFVFASGGNKNLPPAACKKDFNSFEAWREDLRVEAQKKGISKETWDLALPQMQPDPEILRRDQSQGAFYVNFLDYSIPRSHSRLTRARSILKKHKTLMDKVEATYGIPGEILIALWGLETDFAMVVNAKAYPIIRSMTTLAYDCRRPSIFRENLLSALLFIEKGELGLDEMVGQWAGEIGGLQLTPSNYYEFGVDFDKDGERNIVKSTPDLMASAASMLKSYGWKKGEPYLLEVAVPEKMNWEEADLTATKMKNLASWKTAGVTLPNGKSLPALSQPAALMLPMGRLGPAFLAFPNFKTLFQWNASLNNALTVGYFASRIKDPSLAPMSRGRGQAEVLTKSELTELQNLLAKKGYEVGKIDGFLGTQTRAATQSVQLKLGLPADAYPTPEVLNKLRTM